MKSQEDRVLIVGAGPAGLSTAHHLERLGIDCRILERGSTPGDSFAHMPKSMELVSPACFSELPGMRFPPGSPEYLPMRDFHAYLQAYAERLAMPIELGCSIAKARREQDAFELTAEDGRTFRSASLVAATGVYSTPHYPPEIDRSRLTIPCSHSHDFVDAEPFKGLSVLVIGAALSGQEVALGISRVGRAALAARRPFTIVPRRILGIDAHWFIWLPEKTPVRWVPWLVPIREPMAGGEIRRALKSGAIASRPAIASVEGERVRFAGGLEERYDHLVFATGYRPTTGWLADLCTTTDEQITDQADNRSKRFPDLYFVGLPYARNFASRYLRGIRCDSEQVARMIADRR